MHPPLTLDVVGEAEEAAVSPPTLTLLARVERLEEQICQLAALQDKQLSPRVEQRSPVWSEPSTPPSVERRSKSAMAVLGDTVTKGTVLERVANLEHMQAAISRTASPNGKSPNKATRSLFSTSPASKPSLREESIVDKVSEGDLELPQKAASTAENGHQTDNGRHEARLESVLATPEQAGKSEEEPQNSAVLLTKQQEESESGGSNTRTEPAASTKEEEESPLASTSTEEAEQAPPVQETEQTPSVQQAEQVLSTEPVTNSTQDSRSPPLQEQDKKLEMENNHRPLTSTSVKESKPSKGKPWKRLQNYFKKKLHSMSSSKNHDSL